MLYAIRHKITKWFQVGFVTEGNRSVWHPASPVPVTRYTSVAVAASVMSGYANPGAFEVVPVA